MNGDAITLFDFIAKCVLEMSINHIIIAYS